MSICISNIYDSIHKNHPKVKMKVNIVAPQLHTHPKRGQKSIAVALKTLHSCMRPAVASQLQTWWLHMT